MVITIIGPVIASSCCGGHVTLIIIVVVVIISLSTPKCFCNNNLPPVQCSALNFVDKYPCERSHEERRKIASKAV